MPNVLLLGNFQNCTGMYYKEFGNNSCFWWNDSFFDYRLWGAFNAVIFNTIIFLASVSHLRAVLSDPGIVPLPTTGLDFSDLHAGKTMPNMVGTKYFYHTLYLYEW